MILEKMKRLVKMSKAACVLEDADGLSHFARVVDGQCQDVA